MSLLCLAISLTFFETDFDNFWQNCRNVTKQWYCFGTQCILVKQLLCHTHRQTNWLRCNAGQSLGWTEYSVWAIGCSQLLICGLSSSRFCVFFLNGISLLARVSFFVWLCIFYVLATFANCASGCPCQCSRLYRKTRRRNERSRVMRNIKDRSHTEQFGSKLCFL